MKNDKIKKIVLCATQRSGSTMVCDDLLNTGILGKPDEYFIPWVDADINKFSWEQELNGIFEKSSSDNGVSSIKIMSDQLEKISEKLSTFNETKNLTKMEIIPKVFNNCVWIRIIRKNTVKQAISRSMARQTNVCHAIEDSKEEFFAGKTIIYNKDYNKNVKYSYNQILNDINNIKREEMQWNEFFKINNIKPIKIVYEDIINNSEDYLEKIANTLELELNKSLIKPRKIKKLSNEINSEWYLKTLEIYSKNLFVHGSIHRVS